ncbi:MAG: MoxR family ATPase [Planctomycetota bacterium]
MTTEVGQNDRSRISPAGDRIHALIENIERVIFGKREAITQAVVGLLAGGHVLLEDVPGTGKTTLARAIARSIQGEFRRIQFTSDLLPTDVLGVTVFASDTATFRFRPGPIFANVVLADELNRTTPRTQSSLLEAMNSRSVSLEGVTKELPLPFLVIATQNPLEFEGTYPLPESQLDRFLLRIRLGYPGRASEREMLMRQVKAHPLDSIEPVLELSEILELMEQVQQVRVDEAIVDYIVSLAEVTRHGGRFALGASPRACLGLFRAAQAKALVENRDYCTPDDVKGLFVPVLAHRVIPAMSEGRSSTSDLLEEVLGAVAVPD